MLIKASGGEGEQEAMCLSGIIAVRHQGASNAVLDNELSRPDGG